MISGYHRSRYAVGGKNVRASWWQLGSRIFRFRETTV
jgi:hypothetical protein